MGFEQERVTGQPAPPQSLYEHNAPAHQIARGILEEGAETTQDVVRGSWQNAGVELVDQFIFAASLLDHADMGGEEHIAELFNAVWWGYMGNASRGGGYDVAVHRSAYAARYEAVNEAVFHNGDLEPNTMYALQSLISQECFAMLIALEDSNNAAVQLGAVHVLLHLGYLFMAANLGVNELSSTVEAKCAHNAQKYKPNRFLGRSIEEALSYCRWEYNQSPLIQGFLSVLEWGRVTKWRAKRFLASIWDTAPVVEPDSNIGQV